MITCGTHDNLDSPPPVPMIVGSPLPKHPKQESLTSALVGAANAFASAISPTPNATGVTGALQLLQTQPSVSGTGV